RIRSAERHRPYPAAPVGWQDMGGTGPAFRANLGVVSKFCAGLQRDYASAVHDATLFVRRHYGSLPTGAVGREGDNIFIGKVSADERQFPPVIWSRQSQARIKLPIAALPAPGSHCLAGEVPVAVNRIAGETDLVFSHGLFELKAR